MKASRRHELKENELAHMIESAKTFFDERGKSILLVVVAAAAVIWIASFGLRSRATQHADEWARKMALEFDSTDLEKGRGALQSLASLARESSDKALVLSALIDQGTFALDLASGVESPPDLGLNDQAKQAFERLLSEYRGNPLAEGIARCGLATVAENAFALDGQSAHKQTALGHLEAVRDNTDAFTGTPFMTIALERLNNLDEVFTKIDFAPPLPPLVTVAEPDPTVGDLPQSPSDGPSPNGDEAASSPKTDDVGDSPPVSPAESSTTDTDPDKKKLGDGAPDPGSEADNGASAGSKDTGSKDTGSKDTGSKEAGSKDAGSKDTGSKDAGTKATGAEKPDGDSPLPGGSSGR